MLLMVLSDGTTYSVVENCMVLDVPDNLLNYEIDEYVENAEGGIPLQALLDLWDRDVEMRRIYALKMSCEVTDG